MEEVCGLLSLSLETHGWTAAAISTGEIVVRACVVRERVCVWVTGGLECRAGVQMQVRGVEPTREARRSTRCGRSFGDGDLFVVTSVGPIRSQGFAGVVEETRPQEALGCLHVHYQQHVLRQPGRPYRFKHRHVGSSAIGAHVNTLYQFC